MVKTLSTTTNYNLSLCDDATKKFKEWREEMNGVDNSNMIIIDTALGEKADKSGTVEAILYASSWSGSVSPYTQEISVSGLSAEQNGLIFISHSATVEQRDSGREALLSVVGQSAGKLTISADGALPSVDIPVTVLLLG